MNMETIHYMGNKYEAYGKSVYKNGIKLDIEIPQEVKEIKQVEALLIDNNLYYNGEFYSKLDNGSNNS